MPLKAAYSGGNRGNLPVSNHGVTLSEKGILVTAFGPNPDGDGTLLRLWEQAGKSGDCIVLLPDNMKAAYAYPVNLRGERTGEKLPITDRKLKINIGSYKPYSFIIK